KIADPFLRLWFRVVAPHRAELASGLRAARLKRLAGHWPRLASEAWEELVRSALPRLTATTPLGKLGPWGPAARWWSRNEPEWDLVARSVDGRSVLVGEA